MQIGIREDVATIWLEQKIKKNNQEIILEK